MNARLLVLLGLAACSAGASIVDSGRVLTNYTYWMGDYQWGVLMASSGGNYTVQFTTDGSTGLVCNCDPYFLPGAGVAATLSGSMFADYGASGSATVNGVDYPAVGFKGATLSGGFFQTSIRLTSSTFITGPGNYSVPFTMTGVIRGRSLTGTDLLLDEPITGYGSVTFSLHYSAGPGSSIQFVTSSDGGMQHQLEWTFAASPEPAAWLLVAGGLLAVVRLRGRGMGRRR
jgi:hypothetical protein